MNQPDLGLKVSELREQKGMTQGSPVFSMLVLFAPMPLILTVIYCIYQAVVNVMRALTDKPIHYAPSIPFVK